MKTNTIKLLVSSGILIPVIFWMSTIIAGIVHGDYDHLRNTISQLGAIGTKSEQLMMAFTWVCSILSIPFLIGLFIKCKQLNLNKFPLIGILGFTIMLAWAATYHSGNPMHSKSGPVLLLLLLGPLLSAILWRDERLKNLRKLSLVSFFIMLLILLRAIPSETIQNYTGLIQRFVHFGWSFWFVSLSLTFLNLDNRSDLK
jgi:hypothetical membrane protein